MESSTPEFSKKGMSDQQFRSQLLSEFDTVGITYSYITSMKSWAVATNVVTIFPREFVQSSTYICVKDQVYKLKDSITQDNFRKIGGKSGVLKVTLTPDNFEVIRDRDDLSVGTIAYLTARKDPMRKDPITIKGKDQPDPAMVQQQLDTVIFADSKPLETELTLSDILFTPTVEVASVTKEYPEPLSTESLDLSTGEGFNRFLENRFQRVRDTMGIKGDEYRKGGDVFHNFNRAAQMNRQIPEEALWGFVSKQIISTIDIIGDIKEDKLPSSALVAEKCTDLVNYVLLLEAMMLKRITDHAGKGVAQ